MREDRLTQMLVDSNDYFYNRSVRHSIIISNINSYKVARNVPQKFPEYLFCFRITQNCVILQCFPYNAKNHKRAFNLRVTFWGAWPLFKLLETIN